MVNRTGRAERDFGQGSYGQSTSQPRPGTVPLIFPMAMPFAPRSAHTSRRRRTFGSEGAASPVPVAGSGRYSRFRRTICAGHAGMPFRRVAVRGRPVFRAWPFRAVRRNLRPHMSRYGIGSARTGLAFRRTGAGTGYLSVPKYAARIRLMCDRPEPIYRILQVPDGVRCVLPGFQNGYGYCRGALVRD